jgi:hypothetical protein
MPEHERVADKVAPDAAATHWPAMRFLKAFILRYTVEQWDGGTVVW